jgi:hypothetical protein
MILVKFHVDLIQKFLNPHLRKFKGAGIVDVKDLTEGEGGMVRGKTEKADKELAVKEGKGW